MCATEDCQVCKVAGSPPCAARQPLQQSSWGLLQPALDRKRSPSNAMQSCPSGVHAAHRASSKRDQQAKQRPLSSKQSTAPSHMKWSSTCHANVLNSWPRYNMGRVTPGMPRSSQWRSAELGSAGRVCAYVGGSRVGRHVGQQVG